MLIHTRSRTLTTITSLPLGHTRTPVRTPRRSTPLCTPSDLLASREQVTRLEMYVARGEQLLEAVRSSVKDRERAVRREGPSTGAEGSSQREGRSTDKRESSNRVPSSTSRTAEQDLEDLFGDLPNMEAVPLPPRNKRGTTTTTTPLPGYGSGQGATGDAVSAAL
ncbi:BQ5605_C002g01404 [Microbotryum silenes-dioicae]|uniref:BQ5605_C002g01404 protein n=1 Tax=Microbotryum silenes-dioicae TaxID=796604 RepID=A0A2X0NW82_9BASI|nr:BQ5605_C002g01404 [Microbotryum silenes-dioicae]